MAIIGTVIIGFLVGLVARFLMPGNDSSGIIVTTLLGITGAFIGTFLGQALGWYEPGQSAGFIASTLGALLVLFVFNKATRRSVRT